MRWLYLYLGLGWLVAIGGLLVIWRVVRTEARVSQEWRYDHDNDGDRPS
jgi:hypothetical protein